MPDPFQNVDAAGPEFIRMFADSMDVRQSHPTMEKIVAAYLADLDVGKQDTIIEIGAGAGAVTRRVAAHAAPASVIGFDPSRGFVEEARNRADGFDNLTFAVADGRDLPLGDASVDAAIMHTVLTHVAEPSLLLEEVFRVIRPGGVLVICDADFSKATFGNFENDPLDVCARAFVRDFVTDPFVVAKLRTLLAETGFEITRFDVESRVVLDAQGMRPWVDLTTRSMQEQGQIGQDLAAALVAEHDRRAELGTLYGYQAFATAQARRPG